MTEHHIKERIIAIVPAAGMGKRFGLGMNKPFQNLGGKPLIIWPLKVLDSIHEIEEIIPVLKAEDMEYGQKIFEKYSLSKIKRIAPGGRERQDSVYNGLKLIDDKDCIVLIHDGVRPLIEKDLIEKAIKELLTLPSPPLVRPQQTDGGSEGGFYGVEGVILGVPVKDTIKETENQMIKRTLSRSSLWAIQTPQIFPYKKIYYAFDKANKEGFYSTDDAALIERYGGKVKVVMGSYKNIKITTPEDLEIAEFLIGKKSDK